MEDNVYERSHVKTAWVAAFVEKAARDDPDASIVTVRHSRNVVKVTAVRKPDWRIILPESVMFAAWRRGYVVSAVFGTTVHLRPAGRAFAEMAGEGQSLLGEYVGEYTEAGGE